MKFPIFCCYVLVALTMISGCHRSSYIDDGIDTQSMIDYQPPPIPVDDDQPSNKMWSRTTDAGLETSFERGRRSNLPEEISKPIATSMPAEKSTFGADQAQ